MDTAVGAATWPSGDQVWKGHRPAREPKPTINNGKTRVWKVLSNRPFSAIRARVSSENVPSPCPDASAYTARIPTQMRMLPATRNRMSFIAPYSLVRRKVLKLLLLPHTPMSRYIGSTASS